jgi:hypothetical protein
MGGPSKERVWGETIRHAEQRARETRHVADVAACEAWNYRMEGYGGPAQPSPPDQRRAECRLSISRDQMRRLHDA